MACDTSPQSTMACSTAAAARDSTSIPCPCARPGPLVGGDAAASYRGVKVDLDVMLCDHAQVAGGKLFIMGAAIDRVSLPAGTAPPYVVNFAAAGLVRVPWTATHNEHGLHFSLLTQDGRIPALPPEVNVGTDGIVGELRFNVGRPSLVASGDEQMVPFAFNFQGLPLGESGRYVIVFSLDGTEVRRLTFPVAVEPSLGFRG